MDDGWKAAEIEPEIIPVNDNGHHANGHDAIGPMVELVVGNDYTANGHMPAPMNGNGHDEAKDPQQTLFSWTEFMAEEPVKPKIHGRRPQPASLSMFEWAMELEREREKEPAGAGR